MSFEKLGLHQDILKGIKAIGFENPTPIQEQAIPVILSGKDVIASAKTGSGKTAAFVLPVLHRLLSTPRTKKGIRAMILSPTRELAQQSIAHLKKLSSFIHLRGEAIYGGVPMGPQISALRQGLDVVSATPGRLLDHTYEGRVDFGSVEIFVLDEADRMLDMGFIPDVQRIISFLSPKRQNLIFSATISDEVMKLTKNMCQNPTIIRVDGNGGKPPAEIRQVLYPVAREQKTELLLNILKDGKHMNSVIIFCRTKMGADKLSRTLDKNGIRSSLIHGGRSQNQRMHALEHFRRGKTQVLVATDVASRGIDIPDVSHVVNFDVPQVAEDYIHRIGRTARAGESGDALTLYCPDDVDLIRDIEKAVKQTIERVKLENFIYKEANFAAKPQGGGSHRGGGHRPQRHGGHSGGGRPSFGGQNRREHRGPDSHGNFARRPRQTGAGSFRDGQGAGQGSGGHRTATGPSASSGFGHSQPRHGGSSHSRPHARPHSRPSRPHQGGNR